jgi:uncharacterized protein
MSPMETLGLALLNLTSPPVLAFALGIIAVSIKSDLRLPEPVYQALSIYLLLGIGIKGGVSLSDSTWSDVALPLLATIALGVVIPVLAFVGLRLTSRLDVVNRGALAAHYGSTSLVTFTAALVFLDTISVSYEGFVTTLLATMEVPGIIVGLLLAARGASRSVTWSETLREVLTGRSIVLLAGGLGIGAITGASGYAGIEPVFSGLFAGALTLFLLELGIVAGRRLPDLRIGGWPLVAFGLWFPLLAGSLGVIAGQAAGLSLGGATILGVMSASASYIAAPAAVRLALPEASPGIYLTAALGVTFPFNLVLGIPLLHAFSTFLSELAS